MNVLLGLCGSIAAYKSLELARSLLKQGAEVRFILTRSALNFVTPLTCQTLANSEVYVDQFVLTRGIKHLSLSEWSDILVVAPATANIIGKAAAGIGDDLLSTTLLSFQKPVLFVPAMDEGMWENRIVQKNVRSLKDCGYHFLEPAFGPLASGKVGRGRFPAVETIHKKIISIHEKQGSLEGQKYLVTGGRTEEDIDAVRVVTNRSSGLMATEIMQAVLCRGGEVKGILGEVTCPLPDGVEITRVRTSAEMLQALKKQYDWCDCLIMAAAVGDFRPAKKSTQKIHAKTYRLDLQKNVDLLREVGKNKGDKTIVGFSLEDRDQITRAREKMRHKNIDLIVSNPSTAVGAHHTTATIMKRAGKPSRIEAKTKWDVANRLLDECARMIGRRGK